ncbi:MAG: hypothetical protein U9N79_03250 [Actinomycetota bacterium]|nr:hypothetical protein [Actinomycetota bacterium]
MNELNQELIVDLIGGRLSPEEERSALTRIENDSDLRAAYETQMSALSALGASPLPSMTPEERSTLHAALRHQLYLDDVPVPVVAAPSPWQRWWAPLGGFAVAAAVVVGAVVILPGALSQDDAREDVAMLSTEISTTAPISPLADDVGGAIESGDADAAAPEATTFTTSVPNAATAEDLADDAEAAPPVAAEDSIDEGASADDEVESTTTAASSDVVIVPISLPHLSDVDLDVLEEQLASNPDSLTGRQEPPSAKSSEPDASQIDACLDSLRANDTASSFSPIATTTYEGTAAVVVSVSSLDENSFLAIFAVDSCLELVSTR